jgi:hypothetical protein
MPPVFLVHGVLANRLARVRVTRARAGTYAGRGDVCGARGLANSR